MSGDFVSPAKISEKERMMRGKKLLRFQTLPVVVCLALLAGSCGMDNSNTGQVAIKLE